MLAQKAAKFSPNPIPSSRLGPQFSSYIVRFMDVPPAGSTIHVTVHATALSKCHLTKDP
jgi:hypothetical protein